MTASLPNPEASRSPDHRIEPVFWQRWSPRAMSGEPVAREDLMRVFEAARWAPSTFNEQEWRFLYAHRDTPHWQTFMNLLMPANQAWCKQAGVLIVILSRRTFTQNGKPNPVHSFDAGAAFQNMLLQATHMGLASHGMAGFDRDAARSALRVPEDFAIDAMLALGRPGDPASLPPELREREIPSGRRPLSQTAVEGAFSLAG